MIIEKLKLNGTLKCGDKIFYPGVYTQPNIPKELANEAEIGASIITILAPSQAIVQQKKQEEVSTFLDSWKDLSADELKEFFSSEGNRKLLVLSGQQDRAYAKWFRSFPDIPFPGTEKKEEEPAAAAGSENAENEKPKKAKIVKPRLKKRV